MYGHFELRFDSNDKLFQLKFLPTSKESEKLPSVIEQAISKLKVITQDKKLSELLIYSYEEFNNSLKSQSLINLFLTALREYRGDTVLKDVKAYPLEHLVCRCNKLFKEDIRSLYQDVSGKRKELVKRSKLMMICSNCKPQAEELLDALKEEFYGAEKIQELSEKVTNLLKGFFENSTFSSEQIELNLDRIQDGGIRIVAYRSDKSVKKNELLQSLNDYFPSELLQVFEISLVLRDI